jgi:hypothetical protein
LRETIGAGILKIAISEAMLHHSLLPIFALMPSFAVSAMIAVKPILMRKSRIGQY